MVAAISVNILPDSELSEPVHEFTYIKIETEFNFCYLFFFTNIEINSWYF